MLLVSTPNPPFAVTMFSSTYTAHVCFCMATVRFPSAVTGGPNARRIRSTTLPATQIHHFSIPSWSYAWVAGNSTFDVDAALASTSQKTFSWRALKPQLPPFPAAKKKGWTSTQIALPVVVCICTAALMSLLFLYRSKLEKKIPRSF